MEGKTDKKEQPLSKKQIQEEKLRDAKMAEQLVKNLNNYATAEEKLNALVNKFVELDKENRRLGYVIKQNEKKVDLVLRERENLQQELNKTILSKSKLESLCRELQRQNKTIKEESMSKIREEEEKRKETQTRFQKNLNDITVMMNENNDKNQKLRDDNIEMSKKFKYILEQYELREQQVEKMGKQLDLANQLSEAKLTKLQMEGSVEKEILLREQQELLKELEASRHSIVEMHAKEKLMKEQFTIYSGKYADFQSSIQKSNDVFVGYKTEIDKMSKNMSKLEKETISWRSKYEKSNSALLDLASDKQVRDQYIAKTTRQNRQLQKLCRTLQGERTVLLGALKDNSIECPAMPEVFPEVELPAEEIPEPNVKDDKLEIMARNCAEFKQNLAQLQGQLSAMTETPAPVAKENDNKKNKNKGKKNKNANKTTSQTETVVAEKPVVVENNVESKDAELTATEVAKVEPNTIATATIHKVDDSEALPVVEPKSVETLTEPEIILSKESEQKTPTSDQSPKMQTTSL